MSILDDVVKRFQHETRLYSVTPVSLFQFESEKDLMVPTKQPLDNKELFVALREGELYTISQLDDFAKSLFSLVPPKIFEPSIRRNSRIRNFGLIEDGEMVPTGFVSVPSLFYEEVFGEERVSISREFEGKVSKTEYSTPLVKRLTVRAFPNVSVLDYVNGEREKIESNRMMPSHLQSLASLHVAFGEILFDSPYRSYNTGRGIFSFAV